MSRKLDSSPARREVASKAAPKVTVAREPTWVSIWLPMVTSTPRPVHRPRISCASVKPERAVLMQMALQPPESSSREASPAVGTDSSPTTGMGDFSTRRRRLIVSFASHGSSSRLRPRPSVRRSTSMASFAVQPRLASR